MLNKVQKRVISKPILVSLIIVCLVFTSMGVNIEPACAVDANQSDEIGFDVDMEDKLKNSQENQVLQAKTYSLNGGTFNDIQKIINKASAGDTIKLSGKFVSKGKDTLVISKRLIFTSSSQATLDGNHKTQILKIMPDGAKSQFKNLKFVNGYANAGGAVYIKSKYITFDKCTFQNNRAVKTSGAITTYYDATSSLKLTIKNCNFIKNSAGGIAGAVGAFSHDFLIDNCVFDSNHVRGETDSYGGAIQVGLDTEPSYGVVKNCVFKNNMAVSDKTMSHGGAACVRNGSSYYNCVFINNSADHGGALTYHTDGKLYNCTLINNTANICGGAVSIQVGYFGTTNLNITECVFQSNKAPLGGAIKLDGFNIKIEDSIFDGNFASENGGAVNIDAANVKVINSEFNGNDANIDGGALFIKGKDVFISDSNFTRNNAIPDVNKLDDGLGGAIYVNSTRVLVQNNNFKLNTARNGSAIYFDKNGVEFKLANNTLYQNQAWVYKLPIYAHDIYYGEVENIGSVIYGGNNIAKFNNLNVSNAIYNAAINQNIEIDGEYPILGATDSGKLYQDDREYGMDVLMTIQHEDGTVVYNNSLKSNYLGEVSDNLVNLNPGKYYVTARHFEDNYYKAIANTTTFNVIPKTDNRILKASSRDSIAYEDTVVWTLNITNNGPNDATGVIVRDVLPEGLIWISDDSNGAYDPQTGVLTIGSLKVGETLIVNIITKVNTTGEIVNKANVTGNEYDTDLDNNHDEKEINIPRTVDLEVIKNVNVSNPKFGDLIEWTLTVSNNGPDAAHDIKVIDILPDSLQFISSNGTYDYATGIWEIAELESGKSVKLKLISKVIATGNIINEVDVFGREVDRNLSNNHDEEEIDVAPAVDLEVIKLVNETNPNFKDNVKWTIIVKNNGPDVAHDVKLMDLLPDSLIWIYDDSKGNYNPKTGIWNIGILNRGDSVELNIVSQVNKTGNITNIAFVDSLEDDINSTNNNANKTILVNKSGDIAILKTVNATNVNFGDLIKWTLVITNNGPDKVTASYVQDVLPEGLILVNYTASKGFYDSGFWAFCCLENGETQTLEIVCKVNTTGNITNVAQIFGREYDPDLDNNVDNETIIVGSASDISVLKDVSDENPYFGDVITWIIEVSNNGPDRAGNVRVTDVLPNGLIFKEYVSTRGEYENGVWSLDYLDAGEKEYLNISCYVNALEIIVNEVSAISDGFDIDMSNNHDDALIDPLPVSDISIVKLANVSTANYHDLVKWTLIVTNNGFNDATDVVVEDILPDSLEIISATGDYDGVWYIGDLAVGDSRTLEIVTKIVKTGNIVNIATAQANEYDSDLSNNEDNATVYVGAAADLSITKTVSKYEYKVGQIVTYNIEVSNNGPGDALNVKVVEDFPESLSLKSFKSSAGEFDDFDNTWTIDKIAAGGKERLQLAFKVKRSGIINNEVSVSSDAHDGNPDNDHDSVVVKVIDDVSDKMKDISSKMTKRVVKTSGLKQSIVGLQRNPTANAVSLLIISTLFSMIFGTGGIFRKR